MTDIQFKPGDDVQLRNGWEAEVLDVVPGQEWCVFIKYLNYYGEWVVGCRHANGRSDSDEISPTDLIHKPKRMSGFVNVYKSFVTGVFSTRQLADDYAASRNDRIDCIDLSERVEGQGL